jgi:Nucleotide modification associated domain 1
MNTTNQQYNGVINACKDIFIKKTRDYGTSWRVLRPISIVDQIFIKAQRIRNLQETKVQRVDNIGDDIPSEFKGIINYALIGMIQDELHNEEAEDLEVGQVEPLYDKMAAQAKALMENKNHDYGEAWREMSQQSFVDLILMKLMRIRQIISNKGLTEMSEGIDANYLDIINYAAFALILIGEGKH